ncbi:hypothetical protein ABZ626_37375 [Streptomyces longispororuber]|uniref:hypothetical protein n=1 Tax=Streptomyces longispororuber TaxID=68230 RepID=UPI00340A9BF6
MAPSNAPPPLRNRRSLWRRTLDWLTGLTLLGTVVAITVLTLTGHTSYLPAVVTVGSTAAAIGGTIHIRIHIRR